MAREKTSGAEIFRHKAMTVFFAGALLLSACAEEEGSGGELFDGLPEPTPTLSDEQIELNETATHRLLCEIALERECTDSEIALDGIAENIPSFTSRVYDHLYPTGEHLDDPDEDGIANIYDYWPREFNATEENMGLTTSMLAEQLAPPPPETPIEEYPSYLGPATSGLLDAFGDTYFSPVDSDGDGWPDWNDQAPGYADRN